MATELIIVGGLADTPERQEFLARLSNEVSSEVTWEWIACVAANHFEAPKGVMNRLFEKLNAWRTAHRRDSESVSPKYLHVVKLIDLHPRSQNTIYKCWQDPLIPPVEVRQSDELIAWLRSPEAGLFPPTEWWAGVTEAALVAILCKLVRKKSWNANVQGHAWTLEEHLLTESPVVRDDRPRVSIEAKRLLPTLRDQLLLTKGSGQGKTPKEWSIDTRYLAAVKELMISKSVIPLREFECLSALLDHIAKEVEKPYRLDMEIVSEKVLFVCRQRE